MPLFQWLAAAPPQQPNPMQAQFPDLPFWQEQAPVPRWQSILGAGLAGLAAGAGAKNPAQGLASGFLTAQELQANADQRRQQGLANDIQLYSALDEMQARKDAAAAAAQSRDALMRAIGMDGLEGLPMMADAAPTGGPLAAGAPPVGTMPAGMPVGDPGVDPLAGVPMMPGGRDLSQLPDNVRQAAALAMSRGDTDGAWKIVEGWLMDDESGYKERTLPTGGGTQYQKQFSRDGGQTWENFGDPYDIRAASGGADIMVAPEINTGLPAADLQKSTLTNVEEQLVSTTATLQSIDAIARRFDPIYQTWGSKIDMAKMAALDKLGQLAPEDQARLAEYAQFKASSAQTLSDFVKQLAGTAMTPQEAERILAWVPNPGTGVFDGDSPTQFKAKLERLVEATRNAQMRLYYIRTRGMTINDVPLDSMPSIMNARGNELMQQFKSQGIDGDALTAAVKQQLAAEFGLVN